MAYVRQHQSTIHASHHKLAKAGASHKNTILIKINCIFLFVRLQCANIIALLFLWAKTTVTTLLPVGPSAAFFISQTFPYLTYYSQYDRFIFVRFIR